MTRVESLARRISQSRYGKEDYWTVCISEASQRITMLKMQKRDSEA